MKDSQTDEENFFFLQKSEEVDLLERRTFLLLSKETNEEMEIKDTHMYVHICKQRELATDRWDCFAVRMA